MTEKEWLTCEGPRRMLEWLRRKVSDRKLRLFTSAFWRWEGEKANSLQTQEQTDLTAAILYAETWAEEGIRPDLPFPKAFGWLPLLAQHAFDAASWTIRNKRGFIVVNAVEAAQRQANLLRDIFGNPFLPVVFNPAWRTSDVMLLAQGIYEERAFERMPILADALQDAGCDNEDILNHCRDANTPHARGCWVVDLILGKQ